MPLSSFSFLSIFWWIELLARGFNCSRMAYRSFVAFLCTWLRVTRDIECNPQITYLIINMKCYHMQQQALCSEADNPNNPNKPIPLLLIGWSPKACQTNCLCWNSTIARDSLMWSFNMWNVYAFKIKRNTLDIVSKTAMKITGWWNCKSVWIDSDALCAIVSLVDTYQVVSQLEHVVPQTAKCNTIEICQMWTIEILIAYSWYKLGCT